jgi:synaptobrevin homolog YKT6
MILHLSIGDLQDVGATVAAIPKIDISQLSKIPFFYRSKVSEILRFIAVTVPPRCDASKRTTVQDGEFLVHVQIRKDGKEKNQYALLITDSIYPNKVAHRFLGKILADGETNVDKLEKMVEMYQIPEVGDPISRLQRELDETKAILTVSLEKVLERGEKLDDLLEKTNMLSDSSRTFFRTARKNNRWCLWFPYDLQNWFKSN